MILDSAARTLWCHAHTNSLVSIGLLKTMCSFAYSLNLCLSRYILRLAQNSLSSQFFLQLPFRCMVIKTLLAFSVVLLSTGILFKPHVTHIASMNIHGHILYQVSFLTKLVAQTCMLCLYYCYFEQDMYTRLSHVIDYIFPCNDEKLFCSDSVCVPAPNVSYDSHHASICGSVCVGLNPSQTATDCSYHSAPACPSLVASMHNLVMLTASLQITVHR